MAEGKEESANGMEALLQWSARIGISDSSSSCPSPSSSSSSSSSYCNTCLGDSLFVSHFPDSGGRGLAAARELNRGELILRVPNSALLTSDTILLGNEKLKSCIERYSFLSPTQILMVCLLSEVGKGKSSKWYQYLLQLPRDYTTLANFSPFEIKSLQVEDAIWVAEKAVEKARSDWTEAMNLMKELNFKPKLLKFKSWLWALSTILSRTLHIQWDSAGCLCPIGDLFNYEAPDDKNENEKEKNSNGERVDFSGQSQRLTDGGYEADKCSYCFYARKNYKQGEQVLLSYGTYSNLDLLEQYGFLLSENPNDKAFIQLDPEIYKITTWSREYLYIQLDGTPSFALLCALRIWSTPVKLRKTFSHLSHSGNQLSVQNELQVMNWLACKCYESLQRLPTTIKDDKNLLIGISKFQKKHADFLDFSANLEEFKGFFQANVLEIKGFIGIDQDQIRVLKSMDRWRLAIEWRLRYKMILFKCFCYCKERIDDLSSQINP